ncbi:MAG: hypothetical protein WC842_01140 [Candidatus Paceibacterota bacterium]|jgi:hypothetical protein
MPKEKLYLYNLFGEIREFGHSATLTTPISNFKHVSGCSNGSATNLFAQDIGKKYNVKILDPFLIGECEFLGFGSCYIDEIYKWEHEQHWWVVFKILKTGDRLSVSPFWCDIEPLS